MERLEEVAKGIRVQSEEFIAQHAIATSGKLGAKGAAAKARKATNELTKLCKDYRALSLAAEKK